MYNDNGFDNDPSFKNDDVIHISVTKDMKRKYQMNDGFFHGTRDQIRNPGRFLLALQAIDHRHGLFHAGCFRLPLCRRGHPHSVPGVTVTGYTDL